MWMPIFSATMLQALFGKHLFGAPEPGPAADYARRAGCRLGPNGEWIAEDDGVERNPRDGEAKTAPVVVDIAAHRAR